MSQPQQTPPPQPEPPPRPELPLAARSSVDPTFRAWALAGIAKIAADKKKQDPKPDLYEEEKAALDLEKLKIENVRLKDDARRAGHLHGLRIAFITVLFLLTLTWLTVVLCYVWLCARYGDSQTTVYGSGPYGGVIQPAFRFHLSDSVLIAFITSTTVSVIGIFLIAAKWLFKDKAGDGD